MLELSVYEGIPHLLTPVVTDPKKAVVALKWAVREMEERYRKMSKLGVRNIDGYNARVTEAKSKNEPMFRTVHTGYDKESGEAIYEKEDLELDTIPYIVVIVDEMADLMMVAGKDIEGAIQRLAQMAPRGRHSTSCWQRSVLRSTSSPAPSRRTFRPASRSRSPPRSTAAHLGEMGAEQLLGQGDMLYMCGRRAHQPRARAVLLRRGSREDRPPHQDARRPAIPRSRRHLDRAGGGRRGRRGVRPVRDGADQRPLQPGGGDRDARPQGLDQLHPATGCKIGYNRAAR